MNCPICNSDMEKGECSVSGLGGTIYWVPEDYMKKHFFKLTQLKKIEELLLVNKQQTSVIL